MPSPVAHLSLGYLLYQQFRRHIPSWQEDRTRWKPTVRILAFLSLSMAPDLDSVVGILAGDLGRYHNQWTHSLLVCAAVAVPTALVLLAVLRERYGLCLKIALSCYGLHLLLDAFSYGRGIMAIWPIAQQRFLSPVLVFMGLHWSQGLWSPLHLLTLLNEILFILILLAIGKLSKCGHEVS
jgi:inner membrane protein